MNTQYRTQQIPLDIEEWNKWLDPAARTEKYGKMALSPFIFYRGSNHLFWQDFSGDRRLERFGDEYTRTWLQGDLHAENFGAFSNDEGKVVYSVNDFDEAVYADYQFDVWRMAVSLAIITDGMVDDGKRGKILDQFSDSYLAAIKKGVSKGNGIAEFTRNNTQGLLQKFLKDVEKGNTRKKLLKKWTVANGDERVFDLTNERLAPISNELAEEIRLAMPGYMLTLSGGGKNFDATHLKVKDIARRLSAGTGSLGTPRYYVLIEGQEHRSSDEDVILDVKRQAKPSAYFYMPQEEKGRYDRLFVNDAQRAVIAYRTMTHNTDDYLGWMRLSDGDYLVRERTFVKEAFPLDELGNAKDFLAMAEQWGLILANVHMCSGTLPGYPDDKRFEKRVRKAVRGNEQDFRQQVGDIALDYAGQVKEDWRAFTDYLQAFADDG
ncbi:MAG: DUF2252 domain-containing protein [Gammaproteobacteria bacterium]